MQKTADICVVMPKGPWPQIIKLIPWTFRSEV